MWLKRLVGIVMILTCFSMTALVTVGIFSPAKVSKIGFAAPITSAPTLPAPTVKVTAKPDAISAGSFSALTWETTGDPDTCVASDAWTGPKTAFGAESTGRISTPGNYHYTLTCTNKGGSANASVELAVGAASAPAPSAPKANSGSSGTSAQAAVYCDGASPCYGPKDIASHASPGNCWGWNETRVINISGLDAGFHQNKTGISSIEIGSICGRDLAPALAGAPGTAPNGVAPQNHKPTTKSNADANERPYFVGYFDANKP